MRTENLSPNSDPSEDLQKSLTKLDNTLDRLERGIDQSNRFAWRQMASPSKIAAPPPVLPVAPPAAVARPPAVMAVEVRALRTSAIPQAQATPEAASRQPPARVATGPRQATRSTSAAPEAPSPAPLLSPSTTTQAHSPAARPAPPPAQSSQAAAPTRIPLPAAHAVPVYRVLPPPQTPATGTPTAPAAPQSQGTPYRMLPPPPTPPLPRTPATHLPYAGTPPPQRPAPTVAPVGAARNQLKQFGQELASTTTKIPGLIGAMVEAIRKFISAASPTHMATFDKSVTLLQARLGQLLLPAIDKASLAIQRFANFIDKIPKPIKEGVKGHLAGAISAPWWSYLLPGGSGAYAATSGIFRGMGWKNPFDDKQQPEHSFSLPYRSRYETARGVGESIQLAASNQDPLEARILQEQLKALQDIAKNTSSSGQHAATPAQQAAVEKAVRDIVNSFWRN